MWPLLLVVACQSDGSLKPVPDDPAGDSGDSGVDSAVDTGSEDPCDGLDNDLDGERDEGWPDADGDGTADCVDDTCEVTPSTPPAPTDSACHVDGSPAPSVDPWTLVKLWEFRDPGGCKVYSAGDFDEDGDVELLCGGSQIRIVDALTGVAERSFGERDDLAELPPSVAADIDGDGTWEIFYLLEDGRAAASSYDGTPLWESASSIETSSQLYRSIIIADLSGDGQLGVVGSDGIVDARTGEFITGFEALANPDRGCDQTIAIEDLDRDGSQDILVGWERRRPDGSTEWRSTPPSSWVYCVQPMVVQADADEQGEVLWMSQHTPVLVDEDGTRLGSWELGDGDSPNGGQPCVADLDGDGRSDLAVPLGDEVVASTLDGVELWRAPMYDTTPRSGCTIANLDGVDGPEVLVLDETTFRILDGATGRLLASYEGFHHGTLNELCLPLNVGDRTIVVCSLTAYDDDPTTRIALVAFEAASADWSGGTRVWGRSNWAGTQLREDGTLPARPAAPWLVNGMFRGQPAQNATGIDLRVSVQDACAWSCDPTGITLALVVENAGPESLPEVPLTVYGYDADGMRSTLRTMTVNDVRDAGTSTVITLDLTYTVPLTRVEAVVGADADGDQPSYECATADNVATWLLPCGGG